MLSTTEDIFTAYAVTGFLGHSTHACAHTHQFQSFNQLPFIDGANFLQPSWISSTLCFQNDHFCQCGFTLRFILILLGFCFQHCFILGVHENFKLYLCHGLTFLFYFLCLCVFNNLTIFIVILLNYLKLLPFHFYMGSFTWDLNFVKMTCYLGFSCI